jgi:hypothetical protein
MQNNVQSVNSTERHDTEHAQYGHAAPHSIMPTPIRLALWNANGLFNHKLELQAFLDIHKIDIALISESHFTSRSVFKIPYYSVYHTIHPDDTAHGRAAIIVRSSLSHYVLPPH